ncbi:putative 5'(3')-deoxyribonucleotidase [Pullulanibacillus camelliae]|uniref:Putative 5'(3')-deoxyribonucleotidase n=1 Tax=Pullulanibacillus camelliae TaxID=1707096 RepID=A0A8J2VXL6_9BACL|nr:5'-3'-deoxyribonucleotidase [Pullulanibacillus camelliae]GGE40405.1 putative 5'(3')-deoxyribonucleotidase [Pullulanibacillus camelliae]
MERIAIDMDEVMADFVSKHLEVYNREFGDQVSKTDLNGIKLWELKAEHAKSILNYIDEPGFFRDLPVMEGSQEVVYELSKHYDIYIATAAMERPTSFAAKYEWLKEHFPFLSDLHFVFCGDKSIIHADYLIDDNARHFKHFTGQGLLFTAPHNIHETGYVRVNNWYDVRDYFLSKGLNVADGLRKA